MRKYQIIYEVNWRKYKGKICCYCYCSYLYANEVRVVLFVYLHIQIEPNVLNIVFIKNTLIIKLNLYTMNRCFLYICLLLNFRKVQ